MKEKEKEGLEGERVEVERVEGERGGSVESYRSCVMSEDTRGQHCLMGKTSYLLPQEKIEAFVVNDTGASPVTYGTGLSKAELKSYRPLGAGANRCPSAPE